MLLLYYKRLFIFVLPALFLCCRAASQNRTSYTISGKVYDSHSSEVLVAAAVHDENNPHSGTITNEFGFYVLKVSNSNAHVRFSYLGYETQDFKFELRKDTVLNVFLNPASQTLDGVVVKTDATEEQLKRAGIISVPVTRLSAIPAVMGEPDVLKMLNYLPGIVSTAEEKSDLSIRGGNPDQNLVLLDGMPVYNSNHVFGLFSTINSESVKSIKVYKSNQPARFGGRVASIIEIKTKDGSKETMNGTLSIGTVSGRANIEIPIVKQSTSLLLSYRRSFVDLFLPLLSSLDEDEAKMRFSFDDMNVKLNHRFNHRLSFTGQYYNSSDCLSNKWENTNRAETNRDIWKWSNSGWHASIDYAIGNSLFASLSYVYVYYDKKDKNSIYLPLQETFRQVWLTNDNAIADHIGQLHMTYTPCNNYTLHFGGELVHRGLKFNSMPGQKGNEYKERTRTGTFSMYIENEIRLGKAVNLNIGLRTDRYQIKGEKTFWNISPRISGVFQFPEVPVSLRIDYALSSQFIQQVSTNSVFLQSDFWVPNGMINKPVKNHQIAFEINWSPIDKKLHLTCAPFWKKMDNLITYRDGASYIKSQKYIENALTVGKGRAYGIEFSAEGKLTRTEFHGSYTLSKTERKYKEINNYNWFPAAFDHRHNIQIDMIYRINKRWMFSGTWAFKTGGLQTIPLEMVRTADIPDLIVPIDKIYLQIPQRNNYRMPAFHRLDLNATYVFEVGRWGKAALSFSVYNVYNRLNIYRYYVEYEENSRDKKLNPVLKRMTMFPILPSVNFKIKF